jgi:hypothetical protein
MMKLPRHLRVQDEFEDALLSVELVARLLPETEQEPLLWKWVILAIHNSLQGAMVCALSGTDGTGALSTKSQSKVLEWMEMQKGPHPEPQMALFGTLLDRASDPERVRDGPALTPTDDEVRDLERLHKLRRNFAHFTPKGWSIESAGLPRIVLVAVDAIERLMLQNDRVLAHLGERRERLARSVESIRASLT